MASHRRRTSASRAFRLALILGANVAAGWFLWSLLGDPAQEGGSSASGGPAVLAADGASSGPQAASGSGSPTALASLGAAEPSGASARRGAAARLTRVGERVRALALAAERRASELTQGRVSAKDVRISVHLRDVETGAEFGLSADEALAPASNMKLATTAAALVLLGPDWNFETPLEAVGSLTAGRLEGDLVVRAAGDPLFDPDSKGSVRALLSTALEQLQHSGLKEVSGRLVLDEGSFDAPARPSGWPDPKQRAEEYCALSGGFSANRGCLTIQVTPRTAGSGADVQVEPRGHGFAPRFEAGTSAGGRPNLGFDARPTGLIVRGTIAQGAEPFVDSCAVPDPVELFGAVLRHELAARGIRVAGATVRERNVPAGRVLARIRTPLVDYLAPIHQESNNAVADQVYLATAKAFLGSGARARASEATLAALKRLGVARSGFRQVDGSGLSDENRICASQLTALLVAVSAGDVERARSYRESLAVAGESGTLKSRMRDSPAKGRVFGKTGFIAGVSSLSGIALPKSGGAIAFSILVNYQEHGGLNTSVWKPLGDDICELLVGMRP